MAIKTVSNIEVGYDETKIIESTDTDKNQTRTFNLENGEKDIIATAWGLDERQIWKVEDSRTISSHDKGVLIVGPNHAPKVKLTGRTTSTDDTSVVDATLTYPEP